MPGRRGPARKSHTKRAISYRACKRSRQLEVQFSGTLNAEEEGRSPNPVPPRVPLGMVPFCIDVHPSLSIAAAGLIDGTVALVSFDPDASSANIMTRASLSKSESSIRAVSFLGPTGAQLLAASHDTTLTVLDAASQSIAWQRRRPPHAGKVTAAAQLSVGGALHPNLFASADESGAVLLWDTRAPRGPSAAADEHADFVSCMLSPTDVGGGRTLYTGAGDGHMGILDTRKMKYVEMVRVSGRDEVQSITAVPCARGVAVGTLNGVVKVYEHGSWEHPTATIRGHPQEIDALATLPCLGPETSMAPLGIVVSGAMDSVVRTIQLFPKPRTLLASVPLLEGAPVDVDAQFARRSDPFGPTARTASLLGAAGASAGVFAAPLRTASHTLKSSGAGAAAAGGAGALPELAAAAENMVGSREVGVHVCGDDAAGGILGLRVWTRGGEPVGPTSGGGQCDAMAICITAGDAAMHFVDLSYVRPLLDEGSDEDSEGSDDEDGDGEGGMAEGEGVAADSSSEEEGEGAWATDSDDSDDGSSGDDSDAGDAMMASAMKKGKKIPSADPSAPPTGGGAAAGADEPDAEEEQRAARLAAAFPGVRAAPSTLKTAAPLAPPTHAATDEVLPGRDRVVPKAKTLRYNKHGRVQHQLGFTRDNATSLRNSFFSDI